MSVSVKTKVFRHSVLIQVLNGGLLYASVWCVGVDAVMPSESTTTIVANTTAKKKLLIFISVASQYFYINIRQPRL